MTLKKKLRPFAQRFCDSENSDLRLGEFAGKGNSAAVFRVQNETKPFALKIYDPVFFEGEEGAKSIKRINAHKELISHDCPFLVQIFDAGRFENTGFVLMEFLPWPDLSDELEAIAPEKIKTVIQQVAIAARYLERKGICHRDIKPENIAICEDHQITRLLDLGILRSTADKKGAGSDSNGRRPFLGTVQYSSPEYLMREEEPGELGLRGLTFYQLGAVLHDMIMRKPLFGEEKATGNKNRVVRAVLNQIPIIKSDVVESELVLLARECLEKDPIRRMELVNWERIEGDDKESKRAAKIRIGLEEGTAAPMKVSEAQREGHRQKLTDVAKKLAHTVGTIRDQEKLPPSKKRVEIKKFDHLVEHFWFKHTKNIPVPVSVKISFEIKSPMGSDGCEINLDPSDFGRSVIPLGTVSIDEPGSDFEMIQKRISERMVDEYIAQVQDEGRRRESKK